MDPVTVAYEFDDRAIVVFCIATDGKGCKCTSTIFNDHERPVESVLIDRQESLRGET